MRTTSLALVPSLGLAVAAFLQQPTPTKHHQFEARTLTSEPTSTASQNSKIDYYTSTQLVIIPGETNVAVTRAGNTITIAIPTCHQTAIPDNNGYIPPGTCGALWNYYPSFDAAAAFTALFIILLIVHIWQAIAYRKGWCWVIITACAWETVAMLFRTLSTRSQQSSWILLIFQIFILTAPLWVNAHAYVLLSRLLQAYYYRPQSTSPLGQHAIFSRLRPSLLSTIFVLLDVAAFVVQIVGGSSATPTATPEARQRGINIYMGGIGFQQAAIVIFATLCVLFAREMRHLERKHQHQHPHRPSGLSLKVWPAQLLALFLALTMISVRIIYRLVEFSADGSERPSAVVEALQTREVWFYVLEATPMLIALVGFAVCHPGRGMSDVDERLPMGWMGRKCCGRVGKRGYQKGAERLGSFGRDAGQDGFGDQVLLVTRKP